MSLCRWSLFIVALLGSLSTTIVCALTQCQSDEDCRKDIGQGSECRFAVEAESSRGSGTCSNPYEKGCLFHHGVARINATAHVRVCNSEDPDDAVERGICRQPEFEYLEFRSLPFNWESTVFVAWLMQIVSSELLGVPATLENLSPRGELNFYHPTSDFKYGNGVGSEYALLLSTQLEGGDCTKASKEADSYESCAHLLPEMWGSKAQFAAYGRVTKRELELPSFLGMLGKEGIYVTEFTLRENPEVVYYRGLAGEENRRKLADLFLRPTTWKQYCEEVSPNNCTEDDGTAAHYPFPGMEEEMFHEASYTGHFRKTEENDCDLNPTNCTGHWGDFPCGWFSYLEAQAYHLDIPMASSGPEPNGHGYTYSQLAGMWKAANATKSNLMTMWWTPQELKQKFANTDAALVPVVLPEATQECIQNRVTKDERCAEEFELRVGSPLGVCDDPMKPLDKHISQSLYDNVNDPSIPEAARSPVHDMVSSFSITELQVLEMFDNQATTSSMREAVCQWAADNIDVLSAFVPPTYPRVIADKEENEGLLYSSIILGAGTVALVLVVAYMVHQKRDKRSIATAQMEFLWVLVAGLLSVAIGAILTALVPSNGICVASRWLTYVGYSLVLVPLIVKVAAINMLMNAAKSYRRIRLQKSNLFGAVALVLTAVVAFLTCWTIVDPSHKVPEYTLTDETNDNNEYVVQASYYCSSDSDVWEYAAMLWNTTLLLAASVLAFQTRKVQNGFNESQTLAMMIYAHLVFMILRIGIFALKNSSSNEVSGLVLSRVVSIVLSVDTIVAIGVYFFPKLALVDDDPSLQNTRVSYGGEGLSGRQNALSRSREGHSLGASVGASSIEEKKETNENSDSRIACSDVVWLSNVSASDNDAERAPKTPNECTAETSVRSNLSL